MRTTVTLDDDVVAHLRRLMAQRGISFKVALNDAVRAGALDAPAPSKFVTRTADLGVPPMNMDRALQLAAELEDEELIRRQRRGA